MKNKDDELIRDVLKYFLIFMLILSAPIWGPILILGAIFCFPMYLLFMLIDESREEDHERRNQTKE